MQSTTSKSGLNPSPTSLRLASTLIFISCLFGLTAFCYIRPIALFDTLAYVSIATWHGEDNFNAAAQSCAIELKTPHSGCDTTTSGEIIKTVSAYSISDFSTFLRFYRVKPLYTFLVFLLHRYLGLTAYIALKVVSSGSFLLMGLVVWFWLKEYLSITAASIVSLLILVDPSVLYLGKRLLPDGLCTFLLLLSAYLLLHCKTKWPGFLVLVLLPLARTDLLIFAACFAMALISLSPSASRRKLTLLALLVAACVTMQTALSLWLHPLPWAVLFRHSFITWTDPSSFPSTKISPREYLHTLALFGSKTILIDLPEAALLATFALSDGAAWRPLRFLVFASIATTCIRILLFPGMEIRYYIWFSIIAIIAASSVIAQNLTRRNSWFARPDLHLPPSI